MLFAALLVALFASPTFAAPVPDLGIVASIAVPGTVTFGQSEIPASITIGSSSLAPIVLTDIALNQACSDLTATPTCSTPDSGVFALSTTATGAGADCPGARFKVVGPDTDGRYVFVPASTVTLAPAIGPTESTCTISFTIEVADVPLGGRTRQLVAVTGFATLPVLDQTATGSAPVTVNRAVPAITARATPPALNLGHTIQLAATITPPVIGAGAPRPTGTITFQLFGPDNPTCQGAAALASTGLPLIGNTSGSVALAPANAGTIT